MRENKQSQNKKWNIGWGTIEACNMKCKFCYSKEARSIGERKLGLHEWKSFIDTHHDVINSINYGTGENSLYEEWYLLVEYIGIKYPDIVQAVTSNGYIGESAYNNPKYKEITQKYVKEIDISLDFANPEKHNEFRGQKYAYDWAIATLKLCKESNIKGTIVFLGTDEVLEISNLIGLFNIAKEYGAKLRCNIFRPTMGINEHSKQFIASYDKILKALYWINDNHKILSISDPLFCAILTDNLIEIDHSGQDSLRILHDGAITPSTYLITENFKKYNITEERLMDKMEFENDIIPTECKKCVFVDRCKGGVRDRRYLWYGTFDEKDPYCPFREENYIPKKTIQVATDEFESVHYGYLPTMFFSSK